MAKAMTANQAVQARFAAKRANIHNNPGMKSSSPAGSVGTKRVVAKVASLKNTAGGVSQQKAGIKKGSGNQNQPNMKAKKAPFVKTPAISKPVSAPSSYGGKIVSVK